MDLIIKRDNKNYFSRCKYIKELMPKDFDEINTFLLKTKDTYTFILFYAPWCKFCKETKKLWQDLSKFGLKGIIIKAFNCEKWKVHCMKMNMDWKKKHKNPFIKTYPTLILYKNNKPFKFFSQDRTLDNLVNFCKKYCQKN